MLQPHNGIFICTWYDDLHDTALTALSPLLEEQLSTRVTVPELLDKYREQIPQWAGFDQFSQLGAEYSAEFEIGAEDSLPHQDEQALPTPPHPANGFVNKPPEPIPDPLPPPQASGWPHQQAPAQAPPEPRQQPADDKPHMATYHHMRPAQAAADPLGSATAPAASYAGRFQQLGSSTPPYVQQPASYSQHQPHPQQQQQQQQQQPE